MSTQSNIEWTDTTWNPTVGCTKVSAGCKNCYAMVMARRVAAAADARQARGGTLTPVQAAYQKVVKRDAQGRALPQWNNHVEAIEARLLEPLGWKKARRVFVDSESDLFHESVPFEFIDRVLAVAALCPHLTFQILTKRPERMAKYLTQREISRAWSPQPRGGGFGGSDESAKYKTPCDNVYTIARQMKGRDAAPALIWPLPNVWLGTSVEDQEAADERIPHLLKCPAAVRFLSCEPLLGPVDLTAYFGGTYVGLPGDNVHPNYNFGIEWVIAGGESGLGARPCDVAWVRSIVEQCKAASVPVFVKQLGSNAVLKVTPGVEMFSCKDRKGGDPSEWPEDLRVREFPVGATP